MKNNCKNRKIKFIRYKNNLRLGKTRFSCITRVYEEMGREDMTFYLQHFVRLTTEDLFEQLKIKLRTIKIEKFQDSRDFMENSITVRVTLTNEKP